MELVTEITDKLLSNPKTMDDYYNPKEQFKNMFVKKQRQTQKYAVPSWLELDELKKPCEVCEREKKGIKLKWVLYFSKHDIEGIKKLYSLDNDVTEDTIYYEDCPHCRIDALERENENKIIDSKRERSEKTFLKTSKMFSATQRKVIEDFKIDHMQSYWLYGVPSSYKTSTIMKMIDYLNAEKLYERKFLFYEIELANVMKDYSQNKDGTKFHSLYFEYVDPPQNFEKSHYLFVDDIDKIKLTDFLEVNLHTMFDCFHKRNKQFNFIITSNLSLKQFCTKFSDVNRGLAIERRIHEKCNHGNNIILFKKGI